MAINIISKEEFRRVLNNNDILESRHTSRS